MYKLIKFEKANYFIDWKTKMELVLHKLLKY